MTEGRHWATHILRIDDQEYRVRFYDGEMALSIKTTGYDFCLDSVGNLRDSKYQLVEASSWSLVPIPEEMP